MAEIREILDEITTVGIGSSLLDSPVYAIVTPWPGRNVRRKLTEEYQPHIKHLSMRDIARMLKAEIRKLDLIIAQKNAELKLQEEKLLDEQEARRRLGWRF